MPAKSEKQRRLMEAALHGATFAKGKAIRKSMSPAQIKDFTHKAPAKKSSGYDYSKGK